MNLKQTIKPISFIKAHAADVIKELNETHGCASQKYDPQSLYRRTTRFGG